MYRVSFTGYRPKKLPFGGEDSPECAALKRRLAEEIASLAERGASQFYTGMALGVDTWAAEAVLRLKEQYSGITLTALLPCRGQESKWSAPDQERYHSILSRCDKVICIGEEYSDGCMQRRNRALVDICDILVAVYDGKRGGTHSTVEYAKKIGRKTVIIPPV